MDTSDFARPVWAGDEWVGDKGGDFVYDELYEPACAPPAVGVTVRVPICAGAIVLSAVGGWLIGRFG